MGVEVELVTRESLEPQRAVGRVLEPLEQQRHRVAVVQRVVDVHRPVLRVVPPTDPGVLQVRLRLGVQRERQLVVLVPVGVVGVRQGDEVVHQHRRTVGGRTAEAADPPDVGDLEGAPLAAEPAGAGDELRQGAEHVRTGDVGVGRVGRHEAGPSSAGRVSRNQ